MVNLSTDSNDSLHQESNLYNDESKSPNDTVNSDTATSKKRKKSFARACDACAIRKIKCQQDRPCGHCITNNIQCTEIRVRKKSGPKKLHKKTLDTINNLKFNMSPLPKDESSTKDIAKVPLSQILYFIDLYQSHLYQYFPILSTKDLIIKIRKELVPDKTKTKTNEGDYFPLNSGNASTYSMACSVCAAVSTQILQFAKASSFSSEFDRNHNYLKFPTNIYIQEILRSKALYDYRTNLSIDTIITAYFLYVYYFYSDNGFNPSILYLREAISAAQLMGLHITSTYKGKSQAEQHCLKKIYYMLFIAERFMCIEDSYPVVLEQIVPIPSINNEPYPLLLTKFLKLIDLFAIPDKLFYDSWISSNLIECLNKENGFPNSNLINDHSSNSIENKQYWIINIQKKLAISFNGTSKNNRDIQAVAIAHWLRSVVWHFSYKSGLLTSKSDLSLNPKFPLFLAKDYLKEIEGVPYSELEVYGSSMCLMILEIANGIIELFIQLTSMFQPENSNTSSDVNDRFALTNDEMREGTQSLSNLFNFVSKLKIINSSSPPNVFRLYQKIKNVLVKYNHIAGMDNTETLDMISPIGSGSASSSSFKKRESSEGLINVKGNENYAAKSITNPISMQSSSISSIPGIQNNTQNISLKVGLEWPAFLDESNSTPLSYNVAAPNLEFMNNSISPPLQQEDINQPHLISSLTSSTINRVPDSSLVPISQADMEMVSRNSQNSGNLYSAFMYPGRDIPESVYQSLDYGNHQQQYLLQQQFYQNFNSDPNPINPLIVEDAAANGKFEDENI